MILGIGICGRIDTQIIGKAAHFAAIIPRTIAAIRAIAAATAAAIARRRQLRKG